jgi:hemerythrin-like domain-containing protein
MNPIITLLKEEHQNIDRLLGLLEQELNVFDRGERPEYELLSAVIRYFQDYPDRRHHPKEDVIFGLLAERDPSLAAAIEDLKAGRQGEASRLRRFAQIVERIQVDHEVLREAFHDAVRQFVDYQRRHIEKEESVLFAAAERALSAEDWAAVTARRWDRKDPLFNSDAEEEFRLLRGRLLEWEKEAADEREGA